MDSRCPISEKRLYPEEVYPCDREATRDGLEALTCPREYPSQGEAGDESVRCLTGEKLVFLQHESTDDGRPAGKNHCRWHHE